MLTGLTQGFGEQREEPESKPRAFFYQQRGKGTYRRRHLWGVGLTAAVTCMNNCMADVEDTAQRAAARSSLALAMEGWGCREDPQSWNWDHMAGAMEEWLRKSNSKPMGVVWMMATSLLAREHLLQWSASEGADRSGWMRDFGSEQRSRWGRWRASAPKGDPLHPLAPHWEAPKSDHIDEVLEERELGHELAHCLVNAGVVCVGHLCRTQVSAAGTKSHA